MELFGNDMKQAQFPGSFPHLFKTSILIRFCLSAPLLFLGLGTLFVLYTYCFVWRIMKSLVNGAWSPESFVTSIFSGLTVSCSN